MALRYAMLGETYLKGCGSEHRTEIANQVWLTKKLRAIANELKKLPKNARDEHLRARLKGMHFPSEGVTLPLDAR